jgi:hypothetical protein
LAGASLNAAFGQQGKTTGVFFYCFDTQNQLHSRSGGFPGHTMMMDMLSSQGTLEEVLRHLDAIDLASARVTTTIVRTNVTSHATRRKATMMTNPIISRWRNNDVVQGDDVKLLRELELCVSYFSIVSGRYDLSHHPGPAAVLEISPQGAFVNSSLDHCFEGFATISKLFSRTGSLRQPLPSTSYLFHFDRWYTSCTFHGHRLAEEELGFVGPGFQCFSVSTYGSTEATPEDYLYECRPGPTTELGWDNVPRNNRPIRETEEEEDEDDEEGADEDDPPPPNRLQRIGQKSMSWSEVLACKEQGT